MVAEPSLFVVLTLAFWLGLLHALDADHIMAVTMLSSTRPSRAASLAFCLRWALGHGLTLSLIGIAVFLLGLSIPPRFSAAAELIVGIVLIMIGGWVMLDLMRNKLHLHFHRHGLLPRHSHWHRHEQPASHHPGSHRHRHGATMVGVLHGAAGSAPMLAIIPVAGQQSPWFGVAYLVLFSLGVLMAMVLFGSLIGVAFDRLNRSGGRVLLGARLAIAVLSVGIGSLWVYSAA